jgi:uncharacterized membrane protein YfcA
VDLVQSVELGAASALAAILGSMLGLGGGVFLVPIFTLFFDVSQNAAIAASAIAVVTNSVVGSQVHLKSGFTNLRLGMTLQVSMALGALCGAFIGVYAPDSILYVLFGMVLLYSAVSMMIKRKAPPPDVAGSDPLRLGASFHDPAIKNDIHYVPHDVPVGLGISGGAGILSGMLGVGGGVIAVPAMNLLMRVPIKAAAGTSAFMVGITSVSTAFVYYSSGKVDPTVVAPAMIGIFAGGRLGSTLTKRLKTANLIVIFVAILLFLGASMLLKGLGVDVPWQRR